MMNPQDKIIRDRIEGLEKQVATLEELVGELYDAIEPLLQPNLTGDILWKRK
jgi:prefoldin subunit 5